MALRGIKVLEFAGLAPAPFCGMILSDFGAKVIRVDRPGHSLDVLSRGKQSLCVDLKHSDANRLFLTLFDKVDIVIDPFRPHVMEGVGLGPEIAMKRNERLIYARLTGFGQSGQAAPMAGHDINYVALSGALSLLGQKGQNPSPPVNLLADFAGGGLMCAMGITMALLERNQSGKGQVIDCAMVDGVSYLSTFLVNYKKMFGWGARGTNMLDGGAPFYSTYLTSDDKFVAVGAIEPKFFRILIEKLGLPLSLCESQMDESEWPQMQKSFADAFRAMTRAHWESVFSGTDACVTPVLEMDEIGSHPLVAGRRLMSDEGNVQPAPRLYRTPAQNADSPMPRVGEHSVSVLKEFGFGDEEIGKLIREKCVQQMNPAKL